MPARRLAWMLGLLVAAGLALALLHPGPSPAAAGDGFVDIGAGLAGIHTGGVAWGDYDNDGDLDLVLTGYTGDSESVARIYRNDGGRSSWPMARCPAARAPAVAWGDYDSDGDLDVFLAGGPAPLTSRGYTVTTVTARSTDIGAGLTGVQDGDADWGDYDNDGDLDCAAHGLCHRLPAHHPRLPQ